MIANVKERVSSTRTSDYLAFAVVFLGTAALPTIAISVAGRSLFLQDVVAGIAIVVFLGRREVVVLPAVLTAVAFGGGLILSQINDAQVNLVIRDLRFPLGLLAGMVVAGAVGRGVKVTVLARAVQISLTISAALTLIQGVSGVRISQGRVESLGFTSGAFRVLTEVETLAVVVLCVGILRLGGLNIVRLADSEHQNARALRIAFGLPSLISALLVGLFAFSRSMLLSVAIFFVVAVITGVLRSGIVDLTRRSGKTIIISFFAVFASITGYVFLRLALPELLSGLVSGVSRRVIAGISGDGAEVEYSNLARELENRSAFAAWSDRPFTGIGLGVPYRDFFEYETLDSSRLSYLHNTPLYLLVKLGLSGLILLVLLLILVIRGLLNRRDILVRITAAMIFALSTVSVFSPSVQSYGGSIVLGVLVSFLVCSLSVERSLRTSSRSRYARY